MNSFAMTEPLMIGIHENASWDTYERLCVV